MCSMVVKAVPFSRRQVRVARQCDAGKFVPPHITNAVKRARRDLTKVREMRCAARSEQSIEEFANRLYASDAGLDRDFDGGEPTVVA